ncbi:MAG: hypothetical protein SR1Q7_04695 [Quinella sp. 1Q7]|nr:hypothetical protein [Quinella sp. 1Q7]
MEERKTFGDKTFTAQESLTIDFSRRDEVFPLERAKAIKFLSEALGTEPREKNFGGDAQ